MSDNLNSSQRSPEASNDAEELRIFQSLKEGDSNAFEYFYEKHKRAIYIFSFNLSGRIKQNAEDATAHAFGSLWQRKATVSSPKHLLSYLYMAARHHLYNITLKNRRTSKFTTALSASMSTSQEDGTFSAEKIYAEFLRLVFEEIARLPEPTRQVFLATHVQGKTRHEIAETMQISERTVYNENRKAIQKIRGRFAENGVDVSFHLITLLFSILYLLA